MTARRPLIKWVGGKAASAGLIWQTIHDANTYVRAGAYTWVEPFLGAGGMFLGRPDTVPEPQSSVLRDANGRLSNMHLMVKYDPDGVSDALAALPQGRTDVETYKAHVALFNASYEGNVTNAALLIWLNRHCFNGIYRENGSGAFNVPIGKGTVRLPTPAEIREVSLCLQKTSILPGSVHRELPEHLEHFSNVSYLDPPYLPQRLTKSYTGYTAFPFGLDAHRQMVATVAASKQADVWASGSASDLTREIYLDSGVFEHVLDIPVRRSVGARADTRVVTCEWLMRRKGVLC